MNIRIGQGYDVHQFQAGGQLVLGGVLINYDKSLAAHSDGDVLLHAIGDALLGAVALGDLGQHFPASDERWRDCSSSLLLGHIKGLIQPAGWTVLNIDATVILQKPRLSPHINMMRQQIADCLDIKQSQVSVKATTTDHLGFTGRAEGIAATAAVLLRNKT